MTKQTEPQFASMDVVVMKKVELLETLVKNKAKHDTLYQISVSGYWELANTILEKKRTELLTSLVELKDDVKYQLDKIQTKIENKQELPSSIYYHGFSWNNGLNLQYPENHTNDYERAIRMMNSSIYEEVQLTVAQYDQYVLNNWEWKNKFLIASNNILGNISGCYFTNPGVTGYLNGSIGQKDIALNTVYNNSASSFEKEIHSKNFNF